LTTQPGWLFQLGGCARMPTTRLCASFRTKAVPSMRLHHLSGPAAQAADRLLGLASNVPLAGVERSCKLSRGVLSRERLLLGQARAQLAGTAMDIAHSTLGMPARAKPPYEQDHQRANFVYLGFDGTTDSLSYRIYLEFPVNLAHQYDPATGQMGKALLARDTSGTHSTRNGICTMSPTTGGTPN